jgi:hypothetical protein
MAQPKQPQPRSIGYGKTWTKEIERMMELELQLAQHPQAAKQMASHLPGKTAKKIRDKKRNHRIDVWKAKVETTPAAPLRLHRTCQTIPHTSLLITYQRLSPRLQKA